MEIARATFDKVSKNPNSAASAIELAKADYDKRALVATDAMELYQQSISMLFYRLLDY